MAFPMMRRGFCLVRVNIVIETTQQKKIVHISHQTLLFISRELRIIINIKISLGQCDEDFFCSVLCLKSNGFEPPLVLPAALFDD